jgi:hypothetical protein
MYLLHRRTHFCVSPRLIFGSIAFSLLALSCNILSLECKFALSIPVKKERVLKGNASSNNGNNKGK